MPWCCKRTTYDQLPDQNEICKKKGTSCGYVEQKVGQCYEKRLAVLDGRRLLVYKYFLFGVCAGEPLIGNSYDLEKMTRMKISLENDETLVTLKIKRKKVELKLPQKTAEAWITTLIKKKGGDLTHTTHAPEFSHGAYLQNQILKSESSRKSSSKAEPSKKKTVEPRKPSESQTESSEKPQPKSSEQPEKTTTTVSEKKPAPVSDFSDGNIISSSSDRLVEKEQSSDVKTRESENKNEDQSSGLSSSAASVKINPNRSPAP
ncbi:unnamed protein product [Caenorhabditis auriculariae]|uniref:PH-15 domain-containing protein n=1 Tax=Caenorhabditis auriculariae TaxID=2777116 RepID=A0A8S1HH56_9PELO|nr:unnamed protein product [Caenorhabditis auriculariae]